MLTHALAVAVRLVPSCGLLYPFELYLTTIFPRHRRLLYLVLRPNMPTQRWLMCVPSDLAATRRLGADRVGSPDGDRLRVHRLRNFGYHDCKQFSLDFLSEYFSPRFI